jgi:hypothetical protein
MRNYFKTKKRLEIALDNATRIEGFEDYLLDYHIASHDLQLDDNGVGRDLPYWLDDPKYTEGEYVVSLCYGYHATSVYDTKFSGELYSFIESVPLSDEIELQADDGGLCYYYVGPIGLEVWKKK